MQFIPTINYPDSEKSKLSALESLFRDWHQQFVNNGTILKNHEAEGMVFDGFYPHYFSQKKKVLFIGWEPVGLEGDHYIDTLYECYRETKKVGSRQLDQSQFHYLMMYITYGILNGLPAWKDIPNASKIGDTFGSSDGLSFAFMNISKLSNDIWQADHDVINAAYTLSTQPRNFIQEEVAVLEPDIVITMCRTKKDKIASLGQLTPINASEDMESFWLDNNSHRCLLINTWHFSAHKANINSFYVPICDEIRRIQAS